jgi:hypothetical protein
LTDIDSFVEEIAQADAAAEVRFQANEILLRRGHRGIKEALLRDLPLLDDPPSGAAGLWAMGRIGPHG